MQTYNYLFPITNQIKGYAAFMGNVHVFYTILRDEPVIECVMWNGVNILPVLQMEEDTRVGSPLFDQIYDAAFELIRDMKREVTHA